MRSIKKKTDEEFTEEELAEIAAKGSKAEMDTYSEYSVGAAVVIKLSTPRVNRETDVNVVRHAYRGSNINLSGMQSKVHAEQLALFQAILDIEEENLQLYAELEEVMVVTSEHDRALRCGHCFQVITGVCGHYNWDTSTVAYSSAAGKHTDDDRGNPEGIVWDYRRSTLAKEFADTYVETKGSYDE